MLIGIVRQTRHSQFYMVINSKCPHLLSSLSADCLKEFVKSDRARALGAHLNSTAHTVPACSRACLDKNGCAGFDFDNKRQSCWLHTSATIRPLIYSTVVDNYKLTESCKMKSRMYSCNLFHCCNTQCCGVTHVSVRYLPKCTYQFLITGRLMAISCEESHTKTCNLHLA